MSNMIVREADHADIKSNMPSVSCRICGQTAQIPAEALGVAHWDELYGQERGELDEVLPPLYSKAQWEHDRELERWSQQHALTHSEAEHQEHEKVRSTGT